MGTLFDDQGNGETILVVEDNHAAREALEAILEALGYRSLLAADGREALSLFRAQPQHVDLVISDLIMPEMGGPELYEVLKEERPDVKMMIMTGYPLEDNGKQLLERGIVTWIQKPFNMRELSARIRSVLGPIM